MRLPSPQVVTHPSRLGLPGSECQLLFLRRSAGPVEVGDGDRVVRPEARM